MDRSSIMDGRALVVASPAGAAQDATPFAWLTLALIRSIPAAAIEGCVTHEQLRATARLIAEDARGQRLSIERLLVGLKRVWASQAEVRQLAAYDARDLLDRLVSLCIHAYYHRDGWESSAGQLRSARGGERDRLMDRSAADARMDRWSAWSPRPGPAGQSWPQD